MPCPPGKRKDHASARAGLDEGALGPNDPPNTPNPPYTPDPPATPTRPVTPIPQQLVTPTRPVTPSPAAPHPSADPEADPDSPPVSVDSVADEDSDRDWCEEEEFSDSEGDFDISSSDESTELLGPPPRTLAHILEDCFVEDREYAPLELAPLIQDVSVRDVRASGVLKMRLAIEQSGWVRSSLMIAHDRENGRPPVLLEGAHRAKALIQIYSKHVAWPLTQDLTVTVKILKGLSLSEEKQIGRESNLVHSENVKMTLVDQVVAMWKALETCREAGNFSPEQKKIPISFLVHMHPDYKDPDGKSKSLVSSSVRRWKQVAEGFGKEAMRYMRMVHKESEYLGPDNQGLVRHAFSTKTLLDSHVVTVLEGSPGPQLWYLKRVVDLESAGKLKDHDARWCEELASLLKSIEKLCEDFVDLVDRKCPRLSQFVRGLSNLLHTGVARVDPEIHQIVVASNQFELFEDFAESYLYQATNDKEWQEVCVLHRTDKRFYSYGLEKLLADICFGGNRKKVLDALDHSRDVFFSGPPREMVEVEPPQKKRKVSKTKAQKQKRDQVKRSEAQQARKEVQKKATALPQQEEEEISPQVQEEEEIGPQDQGEEEISPQGQGEEEICAQVQELKETKLQVRIKYRTSNKSLPNQVFKLMQEALQKSTLNLGKGEEVKIVRND